ncbi:fasciclin-like arabinogalactan protein 3 [Triticum urartu]|nr:fasciclin-like arabinogalactan protein 3 [Triticum urartu]
MSHTSRSSPSYPQSTTMASKVLVAILLLAAATPASLAAIDVVQLLAGKPQYATFLRLLKETKVADDVSRLKSASVLVVTEKTVKPLLAVPAAKQRTILLHHVLIKYFDPIQLGEMKTNVAKLQTMLSNTDEDMGTIDYSKDKDGQMYLRSPGADSVAKLVKVVAARPFTISIMEISAPLLCPKLLGPGAAGAAAGRPKGKGKGKIKTMSAEEGATAAAPTA